MALAYVVILVSTELWDHDRRSAEQEAQKQADVKFETLAQEARKTLVTRTRAEVMPVRELAEFFPQYPPAAFQQIVGLKFTADIT